MPSEQILNLTGFKKALKKFEKATGVSIFYFYSLPNGLFLLFSRSSLKIFTLRRRYDQILFNIVDTKMIKWAGRTECPACRRPPSGITAGNGRHLRGAFQHVKISFL
jgi:hypothetical protein